MKKQGNLYGFSAFGCDWLRFAGAKSREAFRIKASEAIGSLLAEQAAFVFPRENEKP